MKNKKKIIGLLLLLIALSGIAYVVYLVKTVPGIQAGEIVTVPPKYYLNIFPVNSQKKLAIEYVLQPKYDNAICKYSYNSDFLIQQYAITTDEDRPLRNIVIVEKKDDLNINGVFANAVGAKFFTISYKTLFPKVSRLKVSLNGDSIKTIALNDTIACFSSTIRNFSIKYNNSDSSAIFLRRQAFYDNDKPVPASLPVNIMFIKKQKTIYFLVMSINAPNLYLKPDMLYNLVMRN